MLNECFTWRCDLLTTITVATCFFCFSATDETHVESPAVTTTNVWKEREEFYRSAMPKDENDENHMLQRALEESQQQQHDEIREPWDIDLSPQL